MNLSSVLRLVLRGQVKRLGGGTYGDVYLAVEQLPDGESGQGECFAVKYYMDETRNVMDEGLSCTTIREFSVLSVCTVGVFGASL